MSYVDVDIEGAVRDWLRTVPAVQALVSSRVFFGIPAQTEWPICVVKDVGGAPDPGLPTTAPLIQIDCWGEGRNKAQANAVKRAVVTALQNLTSGSALNGEVVALGAQTLSAPWLPDPDTDQARYAITAEVFAKPA